MGKDGGVIRRGMGNSDRGEGEVETVTKRVGYMRIS
jgi:hypothetical protein